MSVSKKSPPGRGGKLSHVPETGKSQGVVHATMNKSNTHYVLYPIAVLSDDRLSRADFKVLGALCYRRNNKTGQCNPSNEDVAELCKISVRTVERSTSNLESFGYLEKVVHRGRNRTNEYRLKGDALVRFSSPKNLTKRVVKPDKVVTRNNKRTITPLTPHGGNGLKTPEQIAQAYQRHLGKPPPVGASVEECKTRLLRELARQEKER